MKKSALAATALIAMLAATACSGDNDSSTSSTAETASANTPASESFEAKTNIRYYDIDTVQKYYTLCKEAEELGKKLSEDYQKYEYNMAAQAQREQQQFQEKLNSGQFTSESEAQNAYNTVMQNSNSYQQRVVNKQNEVAKQISDKAKEMADSLNNFLITYNNKHHYDAILVKSAGEIFNPQLDITQEVIDGLNKRYKGAAKAESTSTEAASTAAAKK